LAQAAASAEGVPPHQVCLSFASRRQRSGAAPVMPPLRRVACLLCLGRCTTASTFRSSIVNDKLGPDGGSNVTLALGRLGSVAPSLDENVLADWKQSRAWGLIGWLVAATLTPLSVSTDDLVWLLPFVVGKRRYRFGLLYVFCRLLVCVSSWVLSCGIQSTIARCFPSWDPQRVSEVLAAILLSVYALKLFISWVMEAYGNVQEGELTKPTTVATAKNPVTEKTQVSARSETASLTYGQLFVIAILGSMDNLFLFTPLLAARTFTPYQLLVGVLLAASLVLSTLFVGVSLCNCLVDIVSRVPLWCIVCFWAASHTVQCITD